MRHNSPSPIRLSPPNSGFGGSKPNVLAVGTSCSPLKPAAKTRKYELHDTAIAETISSFPCGWICQQPLASPLQMWVGYLKSCTSAYASAVKGFTRDPNAMGRSASSQREESKTSVWALNKR